MASVFALVMLARTVFGAEIGIKEKDVRFFGGEKIIRTVEITNHSPERRVFKVVWVTSMFEAPIQRRKSEVSLEGGETKELKITLHLPEVKRRVALDWLIQLWTAEQVEAETNIRYSLFPLNVAEEVGRSLKKKSIGLIDPDAKSAEALEALGVDFRDLGGSLGLEAFDGEILIIGAGKVLQSRPNALALVEEKVRQGLNTIVLEQEGLPSADFLRANLSGVFPKKSKKDIILAPGHLAFQNLKQNDLNFWRGDGVVAKNLLGLPHCGNFRILSVSFDEKGENFATILELPLGKGRYIFSQHLLIEKFNSEPAARMLLGNLLRYASRPGEKWKKCALLGDAQGKLASKLASIGLKAKSLVGLNEAEVALVPVSQKSEEPSLTQPRVIDELKDFTTRGGWVVIFDLTPDGLLEFASLFPSDITLQKMPERVKAEVIEEHPLLWGLLEREVQELARTSSSEEGVQTIDFSPRPEIKELIRPGLITKFQLGSGRLFAVQLNFGDEESEAGSRVLAQFLTNLGVELAPVPQYKER